MIVAEKPPLEDVILEHYGVKGMRWGVRTKSGTSTRSTTQAATNAKLERARKIRRASVVVAGTLAVGYLLTRSGPTKLAPRRPQVDPFRSTFGTANTINLDRRIAAGRARHNLLMTKYSRENLPPIRRARFVAGRSGTTDIRTIRQNLSNPNYVWQL